MDWDTSVKGGRGWKYEYDCNFEWWMEWGKVNENILEYTFKLSMLIEIKTIIPNQTFIRWQVGTVPSQGSAKSSAKLHNTATTGILIYYGLTCL